MVDFPVIPGRAALVNVDLQTFFVENAPDGFTILERVNTLAAICRQAGILVVHTAHMLRADGSNAGVLAELIPSIREEGFLCEGSPSAALHPGLVVEPDDIVIKKPRFGAFHGTELEEMLLQRGIDTIIVSGISTDVCCDTTAREANSRDFRVIFLSDGTAVNDDPEPAAIQQRSTLSVIDGLFGQVVTIEELLGKIERGAGGSGGAAASVVVKSGVPQP
jgi:nicotinamidase-related amidase